ncbi:Palmitoyltransferase PFA3 [Escovopsis weberi]|uniref:Palmitoyltransferase n=1 Tax=Escovopsis weberi TaxID=150374 RepID=A0A0M8MYR7_ESCWE|nr:Palmitoyltransferase PFA3 [Escovopsis weberi]
MTLRLARKLERACWTAARYLPLGFVYGLTSWACWVIVRIGRESTKSSWIGSTSSSVGIGLYLMLNWCYTTAVFTDPGSTTNTDGYGLLPTDNQGARAATSLTVKSNGAVRFCKKCQARKPDRAHHCSTCRRCVLKMDHHCPWLATCVGLRNYKPFLLFLVYTTLFSFYAFAVSGCWFWAEVMTDTQYLDSLMPVNFIMLAVMSGIIGLVVGAFTAWHIHLSCRGQTTIESLEKTRYLTTVRKTFQQAYNGSAGSAIQGVTRQLVGLHANVLPGITRPEEGEEARLMEEQQQQQHHSPYQQHQRYHQQQQPRVQMSYQDLERHQARKRYEEYLDEQDSDKLPSAFDLGWKKNLLHLMGHNALLWPLPICNTTGDGWRWEPSQKWLAERDRLQAERERQRMREVNAGWGHGAEGGPGTPISSSSAAAAAAGATGNFHSRSPMGGASGRRIPSKADRILGRDPNLYADGSQDVPMRRLSPRGRTLEEELESSDEEDETPTTPMTPAAAGAAAGGRNLHPRSGAGQGMSRAEAEQRAMKLVTNGRGWGRGGASGASGVLRQTSPQSSGSGRSSRMASPSVQTSDDDVD